ncbi:DNA photolyase family protein [Nisaea acidiphila]|uniref:Deoxyribodipyrimidine photo-lyase n=1 Tax=Nisaea acidiphila TaxID=1862145 RepID=A0A9J7ARC5_9PROT|nr:deoxyribodipyrimidine photo-lyase [Nisaea acidiphila]UUX49758.1 DNA photolyase family protein [Nisaea acidiphila]
MSDKPILLWFRQDLRLSDNPALTAAVASGARVLPVYVLDDKTPGHWAPGGAARWWLHHSLASLGRDLEQCGNRLHLVSSDNAAETIRELAKSTGAAAVYWNRCYEPFAIERDTELKSALKADGIEAESFNASLLFEPWEVKTKSGTPPKVFSPYWRALRALGEPEAPEPAPERVAPLKAAPASEKLEDWDLLPTKPDWAVGFHDHWTPGETSAQVRLDRFLETALDDYKEGRNFPAKPNVSRLSPHLHFGEIGPRQVWHRTVAHCHAADRNPFAGSAEHFLKELVWREFSYSLLYHNPDLPEACLRPEFENFPWDSSEKPLSAWQRGKTGIPIVDAGMRELWQTGYMHNRVRMICASFLIKHLMVDWRAGEAWFWDTLLDADLASNSASWQWVAGSGADAAPYFRIFNPVLQGEKFDPDGTYTRRWVPELADVPDRYLQKPWEAPGNPAPDYPAPIVDLAEGRERALAAYQDLGEAEPAKAAACG